MSEPIIEQHTEWLCGLVEPGVEVLVRFAADATTTAEEQADGIRIGHTLALVLIEAMPQMRIEGRRS